MFVNASRSLQFLTGLHRQSQIPYVVELSSFPCKRVNRKHFPSFVAPHLCRGALTVVRRAACSAAPAVGGMAMAAPAAVNGRLLGQGCGVGSGTRDQRHLGSRHEGKLHARVVQSTVVHGMAVDVGGWLLPHALLVLVLLRHLAAAGTVLPTGRNCRRLRDEHK